MANDKKFIVKNGLLTEQNVVIGSTTDDGTHKLQVTGRSNMTWGNKSPVLRIQNTAGPDVNTIITQFDRGAGGADSLQITAPANSYLIRHDTSDHGFRLYDNNTNGLQIIYNNAVDMDFTSSGIDFKREPRYLGSVFWNAGNDGAGSGLDADLIDGLDSTQFLRSDQDDTMAGSLIIQGDLTVSGNTTYINTEEILLSDNIITLNANYTGSSPTENAGIDVERGTLENSSFVWNETSDKWVLGGPSQGLVLGSTVSNVGDLQSHANNFVIQAGGESGESDGTVYLSGKLGGTDSESGVAAYWNQGTGVSYGELRYNGSQKLRTENLGVVTQGNQRIIGTATVGTGSGGAYIYLDGAGNNGTIYSSAGEIGFLGPSQNYAIKVRTSGDIEVTDDIYAERFIDRDDNNYLIDPDATSVVHQIGIDNYIRHNGDTNTYFGFSAEDTIVASVAGGIRTTLTASAFQSTVDIYAPKYYDSQNVAYYVDPNSNSVLSSITIDTIITHNGDGDTSFGFELPDNFSVTTGGSKRYTQTNTTATFTTNIDAPRFRDADDTSYYLEPASVSRLNEILLVNDIISDGDTNTSINFPAADQFGITTGGTRRVLITNTSADFTQDIRGPRFLDSSNNNYFLDPAGLSELNSANFYSNGATNDLNIGRGATQRFNFHVTDGIGYMRYYQDETDGTTDHSVNFEIQSSGTYPHKFRFNKEIDAQGNGVTAGTGVFTGGVFAPVFYDSDDLSYYADFANVDGSLVFAGQSRGGNGTQAAPTYSFGSDRNTGMYRQSSDTIGFSAGNNTELVVTTTYAYAPGSFRSPIFYDYDNTNYYTNPAGTSQMGTIDIDDYIRHRGDTDTFIGFSANDIIKLSTGGATRLNIDNNSADFEVNVYAPRYYDSNNNIYYGDFASTSIMSRIDIDDYIRHRGDENTYFGFQATDTFRVFTNGTRRLNLDGDSADFANNVYAPQYYTDNYLIHNGDTDTYIGFNANDNFGVWTAGGQRIDADASGVQIFQRATIGNSLTRPADLADLSNSAAKIGGSDVHLHIASLAAAGNYSVALQSGRESDDASFPLVLQPNGGNVGIGTLTTGATLTVNKTTAQGNNPFAAGASLFSLGDQGVIDYSIRTDAAGNIYHINDGGGDEIWYNSSASGRFAVLSDGSVVAGGDSMTYQDTDGVGSLGRTFSTNKFNVTGGAHIAGRDDAYSIYAADGSDANINEATFLAVNELGFSAGGGFYMDNTTRVRVRGNKDLFTTGNMYAGRYYDGNDGNYYLDPNGTSILNRIDLNDYIRHNGDTNTYFGFSANDTYVVNTNGTNKLSIDTNSADFSVNVYAPRYYDSDNSNYYLDPGADSQLNTVDIDDYIRHRGNTNTYIGFPGNNVVRAHVAGTQVMNLDSNSADFSQNIYAPAYYDSNDTFYYTNPAVFSRMNGITFGNPGNGSNTKGRWLSIEGNADASGEGSARIFFAEHNSTTASMDRYGMALAYRGGSSQVTSASGQPVTLNGLSNGQWGIIGHDNSVNGNWAMRGPRSGGYVEARGDFRAPRFYDSNNTAYYGDFASTSIMNVVRANQFQVDGSTYIIDSPSGDYGSIRVGGAKGGWAGYAINDDWVFMSNGTTNAGIFNDTRNEWSIYMQDNNFTRLYANGVHQLGAENGRGYAPTRMDSPIFYDNDNTGYFGDFASRSRMQTLSLGNQGDLSASNTYALRLWHNNRYLLGMRYSGADGNYPWLFHDNKDGISAFGVHFNGIGDRFWVKEDGDAEFTGEVAASNFLIGTGTDYFPILKSYGAGTSEQKLFDGNLYWEKRATLSLQGAENSPTTNSAEYVKSPDVPGTSSYVLRTSAYRTFYSDYIEVEPGEEIYGEMWVKYISGSNTGRFYYGVERFDKDKRPIAGNTGTTYFVAGGTTTNTASWRKFSGYTTIPTSHTAYSGSDGGGVRYVRIRILMNYNTGGALREFSPPILVRSNVQSRIRTDQNVYAPIYYDSDDNGYYLNPNSISVLNDVRASIYYDRSNTAYYLDPASSGQSLRARGEIQNPSIWINDGDNSNNYNENIRLFNAPNGVSVIAFSASGTSGQPVTSILGYSDRHEVRYGSNWETRVRSGYIEARGSMRAPLFYDNNDTNYYANPAGSSIFANLYLRTGGLKMQRNYGDNAIWWNAGTDANHVLWNHYYGGPGGRGAAGSGGFDGMLWNTYQGLRIRGGSSGAYDIARFSTDGGGNGNAHYVQLYANNVEQLGTRGGYGFAPNQMRSPIYYDSNSTSYYGNFASTSRMNTIIANMYSLDNGWDIYDDDSDTMTIRSNNGDHGEIIFRDSGGTNCGRIYFDDDNHWGFRSPDNEWQIYLERNARTILYYNGGQQARTQNGYFEANNQLRTPIFYDSNDTGFYADPNSTTRLRRLTTLEAINSPGVNGYAEMLVRKDSRTIQPNEDPAGRLRFGFTSWNNNNAAPYADYLHLRSYTDSSGGFDNLVTFNKSNFGMRMWRQSWNSTSTYNTSRFIAMYGHNYNSSGDGQHDLYARRFFSDSDTGRYLYPSGKSQLNDVRLNGGSVLEFTTSNGNLRGYIQATDTNDAHLKIATSGGEDIAFYDGGLSGQRNFLIRGDGNTFTTGTHYAQRFTDSNNGNYYGDFASTSVTNTIDNRGEIYNDGWFRSDTSGRGLYNTATAMHWYSDTNRRWRLYSTQSTAEILFTTSGNNARGYVYANNSNDIGFLRENGSWIFRTRQSYAELYGDLYANLMYDRNNSAYYSNPASTSRFNNIRANYFTNDGSVSSNDGFGLYWESGRSTAYAIYRESGGWSYRYPDLRIAFHTGIKFGANASYNGMRFYNDYNMAGQVMSINNATDPLGGNNVYVNNNLQAGSSLRAPIFYDSNNTGYYFDGASTNSTRFLGVNNRTMAYMALPGHTRNSGEYYRARPRQTGDTNYWTGSMGWGRQDMNVVSTWGSGFIDSWSNPPNQPSGTSHWVGAQAFHYRNSNTSGYGWQMVGGPIENLRFRSSWAGWRSWRTIPMLGVNSGNGAAMYASIYYDSNNTGYYCDPSSFSNLNSGVRATEFYARNWFRNDNSREGMYNQSTGAHSYSYQGQYWAITGNNNGSSMSLQLRAAYNGTMCRWMYGDRTWSGDLNAAGQWQLQTRHQDGYSPTLRFIESGNESWTGNIGNDAGKLEYHSNRFYLEAGGNSNRIVQFRRNGSNRSYIDNNGLYVGTATSARWADLAERYTADEIYEPGTLMGINLDGDSEITIWREGLPMVGVISTKPGYRMNDMGLDPENRSKKARMNPFIALKGRIPAFVTGDVKKGMWLIPDPDSEGKAKGVPYGTPGVMQHEIIGIALSDSVDGEVEVKV